MKGSGALNSDFSPFLSRARYIRGRVFIKTLHLDCTFRAVLFSVNTATLE